MLEIAFERRCAVLDESGDEEMGSSEGRGCFFSSLLACSIRMGMLATFYQKECQEGYFCA